VGKRMLEEPYWVKLGGLAVVRYGLYLKLVQDGQNDENRFFFTVLAALEFRAW
jgi:hypothetical protein